MVPLNTIRGTGVEISHYLTKHPTEEFILVPVETPPAVTAFDRSKWNALRAEIEAYRGRFPVLPDEAFATESLYD